MKIVSYNLRYGGNTGDGNHWQRMIKDFDPDVICAQESLHPEQYFSPDKPAQYKDCLHSFVGHGKWGSAILSRNHNLEPLSISMPEYEGWVVGARAQDLLIGGVAQPVLIFNIHAPSLPGSYELHVNRILDGIAKKWGNTPMILAGDFNLTTATRRRPTTELKNTAGEIKILERMRSELGLLNAWQYLHPEDDLPQTLRWAGNKITPYHCDAIFLSEAFLPCLVSAEIPSTGVWGEMSDHNPIVVVLE